MVHVTQLVERWTAAQITGVQFHCAELRFGIHRNTRVKDSRRSRGGWRGNFRGRRFRRNPGRGSTTDRTNPVPSTRSPSSLFRGYTTNSLSELPHEALVNAKAQSLAPFQPSCPFSGWLFYFPTQVYEKLSKASTFTQVFIDFLTETFSLQAPTVDWCRVEQQGVVLFDASLLINSPILARRLPEVKQCLVGAEDEDAGSTDKLQLVLNSFGLALHTLCSRALVCTTGTDDRSDHNNNFRRIPAYISARIVNHGPITPLRSLRARHIGRFVAVTGIVVHLGQVTPYCHRLAFKCSLCDSSQVLVLPPDGRFSIPHKCPASGCRSRSFEPQLNHADTVFIDTQLITIQENLDLPSSDSTSTADQSTPSSTGRNPRSLTCRLSRADLVDSSLPGDAVTITGIVQLSNTADGLAPGSTASRTTTSTYSLCLVVNSLVRLTGPTARQRAGDNSAPLLIGPSSLTSKSDVDDMQSTCNLDADFTVSDLYAIRELAEKPNLFRLLTSSLCPSICGRLMVKAGLLLALFGATPTNSRKATSRASVDQSSYRIGDHQQNDNDDDEDSPATLTSDFDSNRFRSSSHVLIVGDPGLGKSQMLRAAAALSPRVVYVCGNTASAAGLTVSTLRESSSGGGNFGLEAGALVLADQGCCCIDEFDKLACDPAVLLEAMEQQTVSVARGGLCANLAARAAVLAAANPVGGHYNTDRTLTENVACSPALLSRFDLIFVLLDRPDQETDRLLSEHVAAIHTGSWKPSSFIAGSSGHSSSSQTSFSGRSNCSSDNQSNLSLIDRLKLGPDEQIEFIKPNLLRKYILYARKYVMPVLSREASVTLRDFYLDLRRNRHLSDSFPVTLRQLESLIRLTEARARAELREEATEQDARDVCDLMRSTGLGSSSMGGQCEIGAADSSQLSFIRPTSQRRITNPTGSAAARRLLSALENVSRFTKSRSFALTDIIMTASRLSFSPSDVTLLIYRLNEAGAMIKIDADRYKLT